MRVGFSFFKQPLTLPASAIRIPGKHWPASRPVNSFQPTRIAYFLLPYLPPPPSPVDTGAVATLT